MVIPSKASGFPNPKISWYKDNKKVDERFYATGSLRISNVKFEDHGVYLLKAKNFIGQATAKMKLVVNGNVNQRKTLHFNFNCVLDKRDVSSSKKWFLLIQLSSSSALRIALIVYSSIISEVYFAS